MIKLDTLNELQDDELRTAIEHAQGLLKQRDEDRKAKAMEQARATLAAVGLSLKDLIGKGKSKTGKARRITAGTPISTRQTKHSCGTGRGRSPTGW